MVRSSPPTRLTHERPSVHHTYEVVDCEPPVAQDIVDWFQKSAEVLAERDGVTTYKRLDDECVAGMCAD